MAVAERILHLTRAPETRSDKALVRAAQSGSSEAASALIERYYTRILSFVSHLTHGRANAEDLTQEVFTRALAALGRFNGEFKFEHWLLRIAKNLCIDEARRNQHRAEPTDPTELPDPKGIPGADFVWESVSRELASSIVKKALAVLPPRQRTVLVLKEIEGLSYAAIAQIVGTNLRGVEATLRRARARFRLEIARAEAVEEGRAACRRVLRMIADDPRESHLAAPVSDHLRRCPDCRARARSICSADRAFAFLPPVAAARPWRPRQIEEILEKAAERGRGFVELLRTGAQASIASPLSQLTEIAATVVIAATIAVAPIAARAGRTTATSAAGAPASIAAVEEVAAEQPAGAPPAVAAKAAAKTARSTPKEGSAPSRRAPRGEISPDLPGLAVPSLDQSLDPVGEVGELLDAALEADVIGDASETLDQATSTVKSTNASTTGSGASTVKSTTSSPPVDTPAVPKADQTAASLDGALH